MVTASLGQGLITALFTAVVGSVLAWIVGTEVSYVWDERRRRRESDLAALATFYRLYGEFFVRGNYGARTSALEPHLRRLTTSSGTCWSALRQSRAASRRC